MSIVLGGLKCGCGDEGLVIGRAHARAAEALRRATTECEDAPPPPVAANGARGGGGGGGDGKDDVGPTVAISEKQLKKTNYYQLLGLEKSGMGVDTDMVKRAYHKALLLYHPDKKGAAEQANAKRSAAKDDKIFLAVQKAFNILSSTEKRRAYDSTNAFDETIPSGKEKELCEERGEAFDFYAVYSTVFRSNARFAEKLPVPDLGDAGSAEEDVEAFYGYWIRFESWRDFGLEAREHDPDAAEDRFEKRWMAKENEKLSKKRKREEMNRLVNLVERARSNDPRLKAFAEAKVAAKAAFKEKRQREVDDKRLAAEASDAALAAEKDRADKLKVAGNRAAKDVAVKLKKAKRRAEKLLKARNTERRDAGDADALSDLDLITVFDDLDAETVIDLAERAATDFAAVAAHLRAVISGDAPKKAEPAAKKVVKIAAVEKKRLPWSEADLAVLDKATKRFKAGSMQRWVQVADYVNSMCAHEVPRTKEECIAKFQEPVLDPRAAAKKTAAAAAETAGADPAAWSDAQQKQLEAALAANPATGDKNARWAAVSAAVDGKTKKDCVERFKTIRAALAKK